MNLFGVRCAPGLGDGVDCVCGKEAAAASFSRIATLNCGLNVTLPPFTRLALPDLEKICAGSIFLSNTTFFTLCRVLLPSEGLELRTNESGPDAPFVSVTLEIERAPGFPDVSERLTANGLPFAVDETPDVVKPRNLELAGVYPSWTRGTGDRVGISAKKPVFFFGCVWSRLISRGPGGRRDDNGSSEETMGWEIDAVSVACVPGADVAVAVGWDIKELN